MIEIDDYITQLTQCLCTMLAQSEHPVCFCGVVPAQEVPLEYVSASCREGTGMAYVQLGAAYPATTPGVPSQVPDTFTLGYDVEIGLMRPFPTPVGGKRLTPEQQAGLTFLGLHDMKLMVRAVACCAKAAREATVVMGTYQPYGPLGGVFGGTWNLAVRV